VSAAPSQSDDGDAPKAHPQDHAGQVGVVYLLHLEPAYRHARHYLGWTGGDVAARLATHLGGGGSPLIRAAVAAGVQVQLVATYPGSRSLERRLKRWHKTGQFCPVCRAHRGGRARLPARPTASGRPPARSDRPTPRLGDRPAAYAPRDRSPAMTDALIEPREL
jgi:hypothetical protein